MSKNINTRGTQNNNRNNISAKLNKATQNVMQDIKTKHMSGNTSIPNKLNDLTNTFKSIFNPNSTNSTNNKINNKINKNKSENTNKSGVNTSHDNPFNNPIMLWSLIFIAIGFIIYGLYYYYTTTSTIQSSKSYYGSELLTYTPVFKLNTEQIDPCMKRCEADPLCDGITFNKDTLTCVGTKHGLLREDDASLSAWVKPITDTNNNKNNTSKILIGLAKENVSVSADKISYPGNPYVFNWSMYLYINDHMASHGVWRHILHKGSDVPEQIDTANWEDVISQFPDQSVGVWMAPFNNNLRIAITTITTTSATSNNQNQQGDRNTYSKHAYKHAYAGEFDPDSGNIYLTDKPNPPFQDPNKINKRMARADTKYYEKNIEFFDIYQFPIKKLKHLSINILSNSVDIYIDGMLYKVFTLTGLPEWNRGNLYVMKSKTIDGYIQKLSYAPTALKINDVRALLS